MSVRTSGRAPGALRDLELLIDVNRHAEGSCLIRLGGTHVLCTASIEDRVPGWLHGCGEGWVTAEYGMLPRATSTRSSRERAGSRPQARAYEIQRLVGRSLRAVVDRKVFGERSIVVDCDVLQADGGTRCASVTGGFVALALAFSRLHRERKLGGKPLLDTVSAVSAGVVAGEALLDLEYTEDSAAELDLDIVQTGRGGLVELQGTAEDQPYSRARLDELLDMAEPGLAALHAAQRDTLGEALAPLLRSH